MKSKEEISSLADILKSKKCFKLVCGAGNEDPIEVEKLVAVYAKAGVHYFDLSAREDVVRAAQRGIKRVIPEEEHENYFLNVSVGMPGDPHVRKAVICAEKCLQCGDCAEKCLQNAIIKNKQSQYIISEKHCIGCGECAKVCPAGAISFIHKNKEFKKILPPLIELGLSSIELHAVTDDEELAYAQWQTILCLFDGMLSLCLDRSLLGSKAFIARIKRFISDREGYSTIIQADGAPMSGSKDDFNTTLEAVATADIVQKAKLPVWLLLSGGTNSKTAELAKLCGVDADGVSIGSFARKIVKPYIERGDFLENEEIFDKAYLIANELVDKALRGLQDD